jgi:hypothetical protein
MRTRLACLLLSALALDAFAQPPGDRLDPRARDAALAASLEGDQGMSAAAGRVKVYAPADAMSKDDLDALAASLNKGLDAILAVTHSPRPWQRVPATVTYYFHREMFISHADAPNERLFIAFPRLRDRQAPVLHEATHVLLAPSRAYIGAHPEIFGAATGDGSVWLGEGLPTYVGYSAAKQSGVVEGDPIGSGDLEHVDSICAQSLPTAVGAEVLPFIGAEGAPAALSSRERRATVAPAFYACATSFVRFLIDAVGIEAVVDSLWELHSEPAIEKAAGKSMDVLRAEWRRRIAEPGR